MGFQPIIDSQEELFGADWINRREFLVWGAGPQLGLRLRRMGSNDGSSWPLDQHGHLSRWNIYHPELWREGANDVTALKLLSRSYVQQHTLSDHPARSVSVIVGTASGELVLFDLEMTTGETARLHNSRVFEVSTRCAVRSVDISPSEDHVVATFTNGKVALYSLRTGNEAGEPSAISTLQIDSQYGHIWASSFLSDSQFAIGSGRSYHPLQVYTITSSELSKEPIRTWQHIEDGKPVVGSVGCLHRLPESFRVKNSAGHLFLSGNTDGTVRLHDLRSSRDTVKSFCDPVDDGSVFSIATKGQEHIVAGNSRNCLLKFFDLRMAGSRVYSYRDASGKTQNQPASDSGWSVFLQPTLFQPGGGRQAAQRNLFHAWAAASPVYSLSSPSPYSPTLFAGLEYLVAQVNLVDVYDAHPDSIFKADLAEKVGRKAFWDPHESSKLLAYYEHNRPTNLRKQNPDWLPTASDMPDKGYDVRWR
jgi:WD40 repeat protein